MPFTDYGEEQLLLHAFQGGISTNVFASLSTTTPTKAGGNFTEPTDGNYARVSVVANATNFPYTAGDPGRINTGADIDFVAPAATYGSPVTYLGWHTALTGGNLICFGARTPSITPQAGGRLYIESGALVQELGATDDTYTGT